MPQLTDPAVYPNPVYKVRDRVSGLWSAGGIDARFTKRGKVWVTRGALLAHLAQYLAKRYRHHTTYSNQSDYEFINKIGDSWDVVEYAAGQAIVHPAKLYVEQHSPAYKHWVEQRDKKVERPACQVPCQTCRGTGRVPAA